MYNPLYQIGETFALPEDTEAIITETGEETTLPAGTSVRVTETPGLVIHYAVEADGIEYSIDPADIDDPEAYD